VLKQPPARPAPQPA
jgi:hypothetical protein